VPAGAQRGLTAEQAADLLRGIRPRDTAGKTLRGLATDLVSEIRQLDRRIAKAAGLRPVRNVERVGEHNAVVCH
jgi:transposase